MKKEDELQQLREQNETYMRAEGGWMETIERLEREIKELREERNAIIRSAQFWVLHLEEDMTQLCAEIKRLRQLCDAAADVLEWVGGMPAFLPGGESHGGWEALVVKPRLLEQLNAEGKMSNEEEEERIIMQPGWLEQLSAEGKALNDGEEKA